jgi:endogenous inhibitor of DNA gyrase (YacG/DUF329 family)
MERPSVSCPQCKKSSSSQEKKVWPFCSPRCKQLDLGDWAAEKFRVPVNTPDSEEDSNGEPN